MNHAPATTVLAIALLAVGFAPTAAADEHCTQPTEALEVCASDGQLESLTVTAGGDGLAQVSVTYEDTETFGVHERSAEAEASTHEDSPANETDATVSVTCTYDDGEVPCRDLGVQNGLERSLTERAYAMALCEGLGEGQTPACQYLSATLTARAADGVVRVGGGCGSTGGFFGPSTDCPRDANVGATAITPAGYGGGSVSADANPEDPASSTAGAGACAASGPTGSTCVP